SPRVRGTVDIAFGVQIAERFIPAGAGNRTADGDGAITDPVHPRGCGEQGSLMVPGRITAGSSPRVRGTAMETPKAAVAARFIPAGAGNRCEPPSTALPRPVHPRGCGEQARNCQPTRDRSGSSPRVRGTG